MNLRRLTVLVLIAIVLGLVTLLMNRPQTGGNGQGELLLPQLAGKLNDIDRLAVTGAGDHRLATLVKGPERWIVEDADGYPADVGRIRRNLIELAEARVIETKTAKPEFYDRLGVQDVSDESATGVRMDISGGGFSTSVIIGQTNLRGGELAYVRLADDPQSYMVSARLDPGRKRADWLERSLFDIPSRDIRTVRIEHPDGDVLQISKDSPDATDFTVQDIPKGRKLTYPGVANGIGAALAGLELEDVMAAKNFDPGSVPPVLTRFETFDGLVIESQGWRVDDHYMFAFSVTAEPGKMQANHDGDATEADSDSDSAAASDTDKSDPLERAKALNTKVTGWVYQLPTYKADEFIKRMSDLLAAED